MNVTIDIAPIEIDDQLEMRQLSERRRELSEAMILSDFMAAAAHTSELEARTSDLMRYSNISSAWYQEEVIKKKQVILDKYPLLSRYTRMDLVRAFGEGNADLYYKFQISPATGTEIGPEANKLTHFFFYMSTAFIDDAAEEHLIKQLNGANTSDYFITLEVMDGSIISGLRGDYLLRSVVNGTLPGIPAADAVLGVSVKAWAQKQLLYQPGVLDQVFRYFNDLNPSITHTETAFRRIEL